MNRYKTNDERDTGRCTLPLILPMHRSLNRVIDSNSPWVSTDPVLLRECLAVYRSVRLILLALIAFVSGPRRIQAEEASGESHWRVATAHFETNESRDSGFRRQSGTLHEAVQARRDNFTSPISGTPTDTDVHCGARTLALDTPKKQSLSREATQAHAPPASPILMNSDVSKLDRTITLLQPAAHRATTLRPSTQSAQIFAQLIAHPLLISNGGPVAVILEVPKRTSLHLDVIRAHAPPLQGPLVASNTFLFHPSNTIPTSADFDLLAAPLSTPPQNSALTPATNPTSANLASSTFQAAHGYHPQALQSLSRRSPTSCHDEFPEGAGLQASSPLVSTQPNQPDGGHLYVCQ